jgi:hypothetical protein
MQCGAVLCSACAVLVQCLTGATKCCARSSGGAAVSRGTGKDVLTADLAQLYFASTAT